MDRLSVRVLARPCLLLAALGCSPALHAGSPPQGSGLRLLATYPVPGSPSPATDIRWASEDSVYLSRFHDGVVEVGLQRGLPHRRFLVPDRETFGRFLNYTRLAASDTGLVVSSHAHDLTWRALAHPQPGQMVEFTRKPINLVEDLDLQGGRLAVLGMLADGEGEHYIPEGVAWVGSLSSRLTDFRPVLRDTSGPSAPRLNACGLFGLGAVRFLPSGSLAVVPGFQPGAVLIGADGSQVSSWSQEETGLDTDCSGMTRGQSSLLHTRPAELVSWLNSHRVLDDILPLAEGPGLLVRSVGADRKVRWQLRVLKPGEVATYDLPIVGERLTDRLHGDVRNGRIALLLSEHTIAAGNRHSLGQLFLLEMQ